MLKKYTNIQQEQRQEQEQKIKDLLDNQDLTNQKLGYVLATSILKWTDEEVAYYMFNSWKGFSGNKRTPRPSLEEYDFEKRIFNIKVVIYLDVASTPNDRNYGEIGIFHERPGRAIHRWKADAIVNPNFKLEDFYTKYFKIFKKYGGYK